MKVVANKTLMSFSKRLWNVFEALRLLRNIFEIAVFCLVPHAPVTSHRATPTVKGMHMIVCVPYSNGRFCTHFLYMYQSFHLGCEIKTSTAGSMVYICSL